MRSEAGVVTSCAGNRPAKSEREQHPKAKRQYGDRRNQQKRGKIANTNETTKARRRRESPCCEAAAAATDAVELPAVSRWARVWLTRSLLPSPPLSGMLEMAPRGILSAEDRYSWWASRSTRPGPFNTNGLQGPARICHEREEGRRSRGQGGNPRERSHGGGDAAGEEEDGRAVGARGRRPPSQELRQRRHGLQGFLPLSLLSYHVVLL